MALLALTSAGPAAAQAILTHVHGLAYSPDGRQLFVPSHHGLAIYDRGAWIKAPGPQHDYMGFVATRDSFYSSGHPDPKSGLLNPLGLMRSRDSGMTWERLGLQGESDFHLLGASWSTNTVYVWTPGPNSRMPLPGLYYTADNGRIWMRSRMIDLSGEAVALAVHPRDQRNVALATSSGVFLSRDSGARFRNIAPGTQGSAVFFDLNGRHLWYATSEGNSARMTRVPVAGGTSDSIPLPAVTMQGKDSVMFIAQNPTDHSQVAIATLRRDVFLSRDAGKTWRAIARDGRAIK